MSASLKHLGKLRGRLLYSETGEPLKGVVVILSLSVDKKSRLPVATLKSDSTGYFSFDLKPFVDAGLDSVSGILISAPQVGLKDHDLFNTLVETDLPRPQINLTDKRSSVRKVGTRSPCMEFPVYIDKARVEANPSLSDCCSANIASIQSPDSCDYKLSPYSFVTPAKINLGADCCESLIPSTLPIQEHSFIRVIVRNEYKDKTGPGISKIPRAVDVTSNLKVSDPKIRFAEILEYRQLWFAIGHSLGEIKYSLPLAPGESTQLAVIEWSRQDTASRFDQLRGTEYLQHELKRDRSIEESIDAGLKESQGGWSWAGGLSSGMAYDAKAYGQYTGNWAAGGGTSNSWGDRDVESDSLQELHDKVTQGTDYARSLTSTLIVQAGQAEANSVQTRRVANHNHCHALTIQYYEVLRHFRLETSFSRRQKAIMIPFDPFDINLKLALRFRTQLEIALLSESLRPCFDALVRLQIGDAAYVFPEIIEEEDESMFFEGTVNLKVSADNYPLSTTYMIEKDSIIDIQASGQGIKFQPGDASSGYGPDGQAGKPAPANEADKWYLTGAQSYALLAEIGGDYYEIGLGKKFKANKEGILSLLFNDKGITDNAGSASVEIKVTRPAGKENEKGKPGNKPVKPEYTRQGDMVMEALLLNHLKNNQGYYNRAVWMLMDPGERRLYIEQALGSNNNLLLGLDDKPVAISGNYVVFIYNGPVEGWNDKRNTDPDEPLESIVTLPTRGLFAEAQLGHCNSCEHRDVTRMWNWTEMTTEEPPAISGIEPGPQGQMPNLVPSQFPSNVIQITQPPNAPDPAGLANALTVLRTPNIFRDMSGLDEASALLGKLADGTISTLAGMVKGAGQAKQLVDNERSKSANGSDGTMPKESPANRYDNLQVAKEVAKAADELGLNDQQKAGLYQEIMGSGGDGGGYLSQIMKTLFAAKANTSALSSQAWPKLERVKILDRLRELKDDANLVNQGGIGLCTAAAFYHHIIQKDPLQFYMFGSGLYNQGIGYLGKLKVAPDSDLRNIDYNSIATDPKPPLADWMLMSALRDSENWIFDFEGENDESISMRTSAGEMSEWYEKTGFYNNVTYSTDTSITAIKAINKLTNNHIALWIKSRMLGYSSVFTHMITLESSIDINDTTGIVTFDYWTWGQPVRTLMTSIELFSETYLGSIVAEFLKQG